MLLGYIENGTLITKEVTEQAHLNEMKSNGWKSVDEIDSTKVISSIEGIYIRPVPYDSGEKIAYRYEEIIDTQYYNNKIEMLEKELADGDYKVIKNYEASVAGIELPYDPISLYQERQAIRDEINRLEAKRDSINA